jgi:hypothetical protein
MGSLTITVPSSFCQAICTQQKLCPLPFGKETPPNVKAVSTVDRQAMPAFVCV